ncbi:unnamed protein product [Eruca vesicaria subsp. sativa]|uniref:STI1 domain-containing protein n=1 Tax=Eruca vesicaria subsp. sativa TaxID=29727 RepID=A0ABC8IX56_ERUVS|nr:unnamed protein product [Eruca vesicaria subsp. sativa]
MNLNPQLRTMIDSNPQLREMMQNPDSLRQFSSPEMMQKMATLQQSLFPQNRNTTSNLGAGGLSGTNQSYGSTGCLSTV